MFRHILMLRDLHGYILETRRFAAADRKQVEFRVKVVSQSHVRPFTPDCGHSKYESRA